MQKSNIFMLGIAAIFALFLVGSVSASSFWEPEYKTYVLGSSHYSNSYGSYSYESTYEKTVSESSDRYGSDSETTIKKTESEKYTPTRTESRYSNKYNRYYDDRYDSYNYPRYLYTDSYGRTRYVDIDEGYVIYTDGKYYPSTNFRFRGDYNQYNYQNENKAYGSYYYEPEYDWHLSIYNWRY